MRKVLLFCFNLKKSAAESHWTLVEAYGDNASSETTYKDWFRRFKDDKVHFDKKCENRLRKVEDIAGSFGRGRYPIAKNACRAIGCFSNSHFHAATCHGEGSKFGKWVPHELNDRQMKRRQNTCQILLAGQKRKSFLHRIVTDDEKWIYFQNPKSWVDPA